MTRDYAALYARYLAGESGTSLAAETGIHFTGLYASWRRRGYEMRSTRDAALLLHKQRPELGRNIETATMARRGRTDPIARREQRAQTRETRQLGIGKHELALADALRQAGIAFRQQVAIGPYNIDFVIDNRHTALEISGGGHNPRVRANRANRRAFIESAGWSLAIVETRRANWMDVAIHVASSGTIGTKSKVPLG